MNEKKEDEIYCPECGKQIPDESFYCNYCGNKIEVANNEKTENKLSDTKSTNTNFDQNKNESKQNSVISNINHKRPIPVLALIFIFIFFILIFIPFFINPRISAFFYPVWGISTIFAIALSILTFINKQPRKKRFGIFAIIAFIVSITSFIVAIEFEYDTDNNKVAVEETIMPETKIDTTEAPEVSNNTEETFKEDNHSTESVEEELKFSFDKYIDSSKVREYKLVKEQDISVANNFRMKYCITVPRNIIEEELKSTLAQIIKDKSNGNLEIDEIYIAAWYDEASVEKTISIAVAEWCPNGEWGEVSSEIANNNIRDSYLINFRLNVQIKEEEIKYGLTESERKQVFYDLVLLQDEVPIDDPKYDEKMDDADATIAEKYGITIEQVKAIGFEGGINGWPMPEQVQ